MDKIILNLSNKYGWTPKQSIEAIIHLRSYGIISAKSAMGALVIDYKDELQRIEEENDLFSNESINCIKKEEKKIKSIFDIIILE